MHPLWTPPILFEGHRQNAVRTASPTSNLINMILSDTRLMSYTLSTHFSARSTPTPLVPWLLPTQKIWSLFLLCLAEAPLHLTSCTQQRSTFLLVMVSTISLDLPPMVPMFQEAILNVLCGVSHDVDLTGPLPVLPLMTPSTVSSPVLEKFVKNFHSV